MFKIHKEELEVNGKKLTLETGKVARWVSANVYVKVILEFWENAFKIGLDPG